MEQQIDEREVSIREICSIVNRLSNLVKEYQEKTDFLEAEVLALGNLLIRQKQITLQELDTYTQVVIKQKMAELEGRKRTPIPVLREEFEEAVQRRIQQ